MSSAFTAMGIRSELAQTLQNNGIVKPTPVQEEAIPSVLGGRDVIVQAQTGTGKTLAFTLPILENINPNKAYTQALILTPTRELAIQITSELAKLAPAVGASVLAAYGGQDVEAQIRKLNNAAPHIIVATPGRLLDHLRRETVSLIGIKTLVLDEADQMLHMGFLSEVETVLGHCSDKRQTLLFSATMPEAVRQLASRYMVSPADIRIKSTNVTVDNISQLVVETTDRMKQKTLLRLLETYRPFLAVVFCRTKIRAKKLNEALLEAGVMTDELHGDLTQAKREAVMKRFRSAKLQVLVATDVAARGLDVEGVTHVFNYDMPHDAESYIHRIGRTGRAGQSGMAITLATPRDRGDLLQLEQKIRAKLDRRPMSAFGVGTEAADAGADEEPRSGRSGGRRGEGAGRGAAKPGGPRGRGPGPAGRGTAPGGRGTAPGGRRGGEAPAGGRRTARADGSEAAGTEAAHDIWRSERPAPRGGRAAGGAANGRQGGRGAGDASARGGAGAAPGHAGRGRGPQGARTAAKSDARGGRGAGGGRSGGGRGRRGR